MIPSRPIRLVVLSIVLIFTTGCDHVTKHIARTELDRNSPTTLPGQFVELILAENPGAFLSLGASLPPAARSALTVACSCFGLMFLLLYLFRTSRIQWLPLLGLALIWSGGISNLMDRIIRHGFVTDFIVLRIGPLQTGIFNLADVAIMLGVLLAIVFTLRADAQKCGIH